MTSAGSALPGGSPAADRSTIRARRPRRRACARLVRGDRHEPGPDLSRVTQGRQPAPGQRPGRLDRVLGHLDVADDDERDSGHRGVVLDDQPAEGGRVPRGRELHGPLERGTVLQDEVGHVR